MRMKTLEEKIHAALVSHILRMYLAQDLPEDKQEEDGMAAHREAFDAIMDAIKEHCIRKDSVEIL